MCQGPPPPKMHPVTYRRKTQKSVLHAQVHRCSITTYPKVTLLTSLCFLPSLLTNICEYIHTYIYIHIYIYMCVCVFRVYYPTVEEENKGREKKLKISKWFPRKAELRNDATLAHPSFLPPLPPTSFYRPPLAFSSPLPGRWEGGRGSEPRCGTGPVGSSFPFPALVRACHKDCGSRIGP